MWYRFFCNILSSFIAFYFALDVYNELHCTVFINKFLEKKSAFLISTQRIHDLCAFWILYIYKKSHWWAHENVNYRSNEWSSLLIIKEQKWATVIVNHTLNSNGIQLNYLKITTKIAMDLLWNAFSFFLVECFWIISKINARNIIDRCDTIYRIQGILKREKKNTLPSRVHESGRKSLNWNVDGFILIWEI